MALPLRATYRLQLGAAFTLEHAREIVPYLSRLGISHMYLSPVLRSRTGSEHGYDVVDPTRLDPEIGGRTEWDALVRTLHEHGMGILLDIVPNHMGVGSENPYWDDLFANGPASRYAPWFDIDWGETRLGVRGRVLVPILGDDLDAVIARGEIVLFISRGLPRVRYFEHSFPLDPVTIPRVLIPALESLRAVSPAGDADVFELGEALDALLTLPPRLTRSEARVEERRSQVPVILARLAALYHRSAAVRDAVDRAVRQFGEGAAGRVRLADLLAAQVYVLVHWRRAAHEINYRRFFDINELVALRVGDPEVFAATHELLLEWVRDGSVDALRVDHVDGLYDPRAYLDRLRDSVHTELARHVPIFVEKILTADERLPRDWPVDGTTGYEFLAQLDALFIDPAGRGAIETRYRRMLRLGRNASDFESVARRCKDLVLRTSLAADVRRLVRILIPIAERDAEAACVSRPELRNALVAVIAALPVYRTYIAAGEPPSAADRKVIAIALSRAREASDVDARALRLLERLLLPANDDAPAASLDELRARDLFVHRFQQVSGPAAAKGVEDTALYRYTPLASLCEVGSSPDRPLADAPRRMHDANAERLALMPLSLDSTSTHDTKRSADVRSRISVLSELPDEWSAAVQRWRREMHRVRGRVRDQPAPDAHAEYLLYQTLVGMWPLGEVDARPHAELRERLTEYMLKAVREAKVRTSWTDPDADYERALTRYIAALFAGHAGTLADVERFARRIARAGVWNALARALVHCTAPGTPDIYQGDELWNFSLVDPDNRRPVDFTTRHALLDSLERDAPPLGDLLADPSDGRLKLHVLHRALRCRQEHASLFATGSYHPLEVIAPATPNDHQHRQHADPHPPTPPTSLSRHIFAFARHSPDVTVLVVVPRLTTSLTDPAPIGPSTWRDARLSIPPSLRRPLWHRTIA
ncbi:MAG TPA: malto-oligosyltrehalose synthase, partial [Gemmatimonadaceae bacterium]|nr:malto-oligosyltrehalose synthase [Gemmatimonadaceae bacterium]